MHEEKRAFMFNSVSFNNPFVSRLVTSKGGAVGYLYIICVYTRISQYEVEIADFFGDVLSLYLNGGTRLLPASGDYYDAYFIHLIEGAANDPETQEILIKSFHWEGETAYMVLLTESFQGDSLEQTITKAQIHLMESNLPCKSFVYGNEIVTVICASLLHGQSQNPAVPEAHIQSFCRQFECSAGYSEFFSSLEELRVYYQQARVALEYALRDETVRVCPYGEIAVRHMTDTLYSVLPAELITHPAVAKLRRYDAQNRGELLETLRCYLENEQNTLRTARELFIHKNTLLYRLDRISKLTGLDLDSPDERLRVLLSFGEPDATDE
ncbi:MAG: helix-turn-helix domain-containing protein [Oscillospiraceae bacterium]|nr:helix-turn-helix domain-containing protein [Oscillospiraceae bacterium]